MKKLTKAQRIFLQQVASGPPHSGSVATYAQSPTEMGRARWNAAAEGRVYVFHVAPNPRILTSHHNHSEPGDEWCSMGCPKFKLKSSRSAL